MQSSGGLTGAERAAGHAALTVLSGPAGGVGGALLLASLADAPNVLCFDMGGTSCDVCLIERSQVGETAGRTVAGRPLALPALDIHTVGAGGGSIAWRDPGGALRVGPASAGALPGPACYGRGGVQPTVTDANLLLGRLLAGQPLPGGLQLDRRASERAIGRLARELGLDPLECARGIVRVAEAEMLGALRLMTVERGIDPRNFALMPFGGAGPLHAAALARSLGISRVLCPRASGVLSALGLAAAAPRRDVSRTVLIDDLGDTAPGGGLAKDAHARAHARARVSVERDTLIEEATRALGGPPTRIAVRHELRYQRPVVRAGGRGNDPDPPAPGGLAGRSGCTARGVRAGTRGALRLSRGRDGGRAGDDPRVGRRRASAAAPTGGRRRRRSRSTEIVSRFVRSTTRAARGGRAGGRAAAGHADARPGAVRAGRVDAAGAAGLVGGGRPARDDPPDAGAA